MSKRLYVKQIKCNDVPKCNHNTKPGTKFYLETDYAKCYNNCMFCAIEAWGGSMPHAEIAKCLGIDRVSVCQLEKIILEKLRKRINYKTKSLKQFDISLIDIKGLANKIETECIKQLVFKINLDFNIEKPVKIVVCNKEISLQSKIGQAIYSYKNNHDNSYHEIKINKNLIKSKKEFVKILIHELFHAVQSENNKFLSDNMCEAVSDELFPKYYKQLINIQTKNRNKKLIGVKNGS